MDEHYRFHLMKTTLKEDKLWDWCKLNTDRLSRSGSAAFSLFHVPITSIRWLEQYSGGVPLGIQESINTIQAMAAKPTPNTF